MVSDSDDLKEEAKPQENSTGELAKLVERLEKANAEHKEILARHELLASKNLLGGMSAAGKAPEVKKEETPSEYAKRLIGRR